VITILHIGFLDHAASPTEQEILLFIVELLWQKENFPVDLNLV